MSSSSSKSSTFTTKSFSVDKYLKTILVDGQLAILTKDNNQIGVNILNSELSLSERFFLDTDEVYSDGTGVYYIRKGVLFCYLNKLSTPVVKLPSIYTDYKICLGYVKNDEPHFLLLCKDASSNTKYISINSHTEVIIEYEINEQLRKNINLNFYSEANRYFCYKGNLFVVTLSADTVYTLCIDFLAYLDGKRNSVIECLGKDLDFSTTETRILNNQLMELSFNKDYLCFCECTENLDKLVEGAKRGRSPKSTNSVAHVIIIDIVHSPAYKLEVPFYTKELFYLVESYPETNDYSTVRIKRRNLV